jgi:GT2 family glycosyltransferase
MTGSKFSIIITTKNRKTELAFTLDKIQYLFENGKVACIICDDGSTDGTAVFLQTNYPAIQYIRNEKSQGLIYSRNRLMNLVKTEFVISIDDDLHFITQNSLEIISNFFHRYPNIGVASFRIYWDLSEPKNMISEEKSIRMQSFAGGAHAFRMKAWHDIPNYPEWFVFYGEEDFAAYQLFKNNWEIHYLPEVLVNHRVDIIARKNNNDYRLRLRRSLRSGWYLYVMFYPRREIPRRFAYTFWIQIKHKVLKGDRKAATATVQALGDVIINLPRLLSKANRLTIKEFKAYSKLAGTKIYWTPEKNQ